MAGTPTQPNGCNCLCSVNHPETKGMCSGQVDTSLRFDSPTTGEIDVLMCSACVAATLAAKASTPREERGR